MGKMITDLCLHMSDVNYIDSWSYITSCSVLESKSITNTLFLEFGAREYDIEAWFSDIQILGPSSTLEEMKSSIRKREFPQVFSCAERFNWASDTFMYYTLIMAFEKEWKHSSQGQREKWQLHSFPTFKLFSALHSLQNQTDSLFSTLQYNFGDRVRANSVPLSVSWCCVSGSHLSEGREIVKWFGLKALPTGLQTSCVTQINKYSVRSQWGTIIAKGSLIYKNLKTKIYVSVPKACNVGTFTPW